MRRIILSRDNDVDRGTGQLGCPCGARLARNLL
jgi:hypothetical protein